VKFDRMCWNNGTQIRMSSLKAHLHFPFPEVYLIHGPWRLIQKLHATSNQSVNLTHSSSGSWKTENKNPESPHLWKKKCKKCERALLKVEKWLKKKLGCAAWIFLVGGILGFELRVLSLSSTTWSPPQLLLLRFSSRLLPVPGLILWFP
jgi:hypothetical protein